MDTITSGVSRWLHSCKSELKDKTPELEGRVQELESIVEEQRKRLDNLASLVRSIVTEL